MVHVFRNALPADANRCFEISAYEGDEAVTYEKIAKRIETYPDVSPLRSLRFFSIVKAMTDGMPASDEALAMPIASSVVFRVNAVTISAPATLNVSICSL